MKWVILGRGASGRAAERLAGRLGMTTQVAADGEGIVADALFADCDGVIVSPGVKPWSELYRAALASGKELISEMEFGFRHFPGPVAAITGTDGKTTTTELTCHLLRALGIHAVEAGNIGVPLADVAADRLEGKLPPDALPVVETSSFQLERVTRFAPVAAVLLNIGCDHLDRYHGDRGEYEAVKRRIFRFVAPENRIFGRSMQEPGAVCRVAVDAAGMIALDGEALLNFAELPLKGEHNLENVLAALELVARLTKLPADARLKLAAALRCFHAGRHRIESVATLGGVTYINDSKATNPHAAAAALRLLAPQTRGIHLLAGGLDKGMDFRELLEFAPAIRGVYAFGECRAKIAAALGGAIPVFDCGTDFEGAIDRARDRAAAGETVLLAPACASMDMFKDYKERGDRFVARVERFRQ